jgi:hypothetical protein
VAVADLNSDGVLDLVTANSNSHDMAVLLGCGDGTFRAARRFPAGYSPTSVAVADLNNDSILDLVTASAGGSGVSVLRGRGNGTFEAAQYVEGTLLVSRGRGLLLLRNSITSRGICMTMSIVGPL